MQMLKPLALAIFGALTTAQASAAPKQATPGEIAAYAVEQKLRGAYPETDFKSVRQAPIKGLYEVVMGNRIVYTDDDGKLMVFGRIVDLANKKDLTADRLAEVNAIDISKLPLKQAIKTVRGDGSRTLYVFSDPDCPYCKRLESTLRDLSNVTIYTFLYPLESLHPEAKAKSESVWCAKDRSKAWEALMVAGKPVKQQACDNPIADNIALGQKFNVQGTPFLINANGMPKAGALPLAEIEAFIGK